MKNLVLILPALLLMGCSTQKEIECCEGEKNRQCDEFYPFENCPTRSRHGYYSREYKKWVYRTWTPPLNVHPYYPNTQTVYYVPVENWAAPPINNGPTLSNTPRPEQLGQYRERSPKPQNNNTRSTRN